MPNGRDCQPMTAEDMEVLTPDWPAPANVRAAFTLRTGGVSAAPFDSLNVGALVGDLRAAVAENRHRIRAALGLPAEPVWLEQVHGTRAVELDAATDPATTADAIVTRRPG